MEQKRVSLKIAKAIKEIGYPQDKFNYNQYYTKGGHLSNLYLYGVPYYDVDCFAPTYLDVWLWLWREKGIEILPIGGIIVQGKGKIEVKNLYDYQDPEEAIIAAVEYLVDNNLIK